MKNSKDSMNLQIFDEAIEIFDKRGRVGNPSRVLDRKYHHFYGQILQKSGT